MALFRVEREPSRPGGLALDQTVVKELYKNAFTRRNYIKLAGFVKSGNK
jgi:hypothetical protein